MKHVFIINPSSGKDKTKDGLIAEIEEFKKNHNYDIEISRLSNSTESKEYIKSVIKECNEDVRFYACGGDGTINSVACAVYGSKASISTYPCGTGNDFVKCFPHKEYFNDLEKLINAKDRKIDLIKVNDTYAINIVNFGLDACVCDTMIKVRRYPIIGGSHAYTTGILKALVCAMKTSCKVYVDDKLLNEKGVVLLCTVANGHYVGGSFHCAPRAELDDGLLEICAVNPISYIKFAKMMGPYTRGEHLDNPYFKGTIEYARGKKVRLVPEKDLLVTIDGEMRRCPSFDIEVLNKVINFAVPE